MPLETGTYVADLVRTYPVGTDPKSQGDDHLRLIKTTLQNTFPNADQAYDLSTMLTTDNIDTVTIGVAQVSIPRSPAEVTAGVTPTDDQWPVGDFRRYGGQPLVDSKLAIQAAIDVLIAQGGGSTSAAPGVIYPVSGSLKLGSLVDLNLSGCIIECSANNVPIVQVDKVAVNSGWKIRNGTLRFLTQQTTADVNGVGVRLGTTSRASLGYELADLTISKCEAGVDLPALTGCTAAHGRHRNVTVTSCAGWAFDVQGDTVGVRTGLEFEGCIARETSGSEQAASALMRIRRINDLRIQGMTGERLRGGALAVLSEFTDCVGVIETIAFDTCATTLAAGTGATLYAINSRLVINEIKQSAQSVTISGTATYGLLRAASGSRIDVALIDDLAAVVTDTSTGVYNTIIAEGTTKVWNRAYTKSGTTPAETLNETGSNVEYLVEAFAGNVRSSRAGGKAQMYGTAVPTVGTYAVGDRLVNTAQSATSVVGEWVCTVAGTPGTWRQCAHLVVRQATRPVLTANDIGVVMLWTGIDPDGEPNWWNGTAWVNYQGTTQP